MAQKATIYKAALNVANISQHYYDTLNLTIARHPSETEERMMVRLLAYALHAGPDLQFSKGLSTDNEPDLWLKNLAGDIELWIDVGLPDESRIRKASNRAGQVFIYCYGGRGAQLWWRQNAAKLARFSNLAVTDLAPESTAALAGMARRNMELQCTIDDSAVCLSDTEQTVYIDYQPLTLDPT